MQCHAPPRGCRWRAHTFSSSARHISPETSANHDAHLLAICMLAHLAFGPFHTSCKDLPWGRKQYPRPWQPLPGRPRPAGHESPRPCGRSTAPRGRCCRPAAGAWPAPPFCTLRCLHSTGSIRARSLASEIVTGVWIPWSLDRGQGLRLGLVRWSEDCGVVRFAVTMLQELWGGYQALPEMGPDIGALDLSLATLVNTRASCWPVWL